MSVSSTRRFGLIDHSRAYSDQASLRRMQDSISVTNSGAGDLNMTEERVSQPSRSTTMRPPFSISTAVQLNE